MGLILYGSDPEYTNRPYNPTTFTVEVGPDSYLSLPVVGEFKTNDPEPAYNSSSNGGCDAGFGALTVISIIFIAGALLLRRKMDKMDKMDKAA
jgi:hypothetical protein